jgi:hypothetical protein
VLTAAKHKPPTQPRALHLAGARRRPGGQLERLEQHPLAHRDTAHPGRAGAGCARQRAQHIDRSPELDWNDVDYAIRYEIQVASSSKFSPLLQSSNMNSPPACSPRLTWQTANITGACAPLT